VALIEAMAAGGPAPTDVGGAPTVIVTFDGRPRVARR
jgi:hypothetical protein